MPQRFLSEHDLRESGLTPGDMRGRQQRLFTDTWDLSDPALNILKTLLERMGFDARQPIHIHEIQGTASPSIFVLTQ